MCKYEMDLAIIVEDTEWTLSTDRRMDGRTDGQMDEQMERQTRWNQYTPYYFL